MAPSWAAKRQDAEDFGLAICSTCSSVIPGSDRARLNHSKWHDMIAAIDQRATG
jgi:hypothetical protein